MSNHTRNLQTSQLARLSGSSSNAVERHDARENAIDCHLNDSIEKEPDISASKFSLGDTWKRDDIQYVASIYKADHYQNVLRPGRTIVLCR